MMMRVDSFVSRARDRARRATQLATLLSIVTMVAVGIAPNGAEAWPTWSAEKKAHPAGDPRCPAPEPGQEPEPCEESLGNCQTCHGQFPATNEENPRPYLRDEYISPVDGKTWNVLYQQAGEDEAEEEIGLHEVHRHVMMDEDSEESKCSVCHSFSEVGSYPVFLKKSDGTASLEGIGCVGCHGRLEDAGGDDGSRWGAGYGAGLRQHHTNAGVYVCKTCHADADPARFAPVGEHVLPPHYAVPNDVFVNKPTDPCNWSRNEDYAAGWTGLDNDGDGRYDVLDSDCWPWPGQTGPDRGLVSGR